MQTPAERRARYEEILQRLVGLPLTDMWRPIGQDFEFGPQIPQLNDKDEPMHRASTVLRIKTAWRVWREGEVVLGSDDHGERGAKRFYDRKTPPQDPRERPRWRRAKKWFAQVEAGSLIAAEASISEAYEPWVRFADGTLLSALHTSSSPDSDDLFFFQQGERSILVWSSGDSGFTTEEEDRNEREHEADEALADSLETTPSGTPKP